MPKKKQTRGKKSRKKQADSGFLNSNILQSLDTETWIDIASILLFVFAIIVILALLGLAGSIGVFLKMFLGNILGWLVYLLPLALFVFGYLFWHHDDIDVSVNHYIGVLLFFLSLAALLNLFLPIDNLAYYISQGQGGGYMGYILGYPLLKGFGKIASVIILLAVFALSLVIMFNMPLRHIFSWQRFMATLRGEEYEEYEEDEEKEEEEEVEVEEEEDDEEEVRESKDDEPEKESKFAKIKEKIKLKKKKENIVLEPNVKYRKQKIDLPISLLDMKWLDQPVEILSITHI